MILFFHESIIKHYSLHALSNSVVKSWKSVAPGSSVCIMGNAVDTLEFIAASVVVVVMIVVLVVVGTVVVVMTVVGGIEVVTLEVNGGLV